MEVTGTISESFLKYLISTSRKYEIKELQETVLLGPALILREVLM